MKLTLRQKEIIQIILSSDIESPCNLQFISEQINISKRTVLRELSIVEDWFKNNNLSLVRKAGIGVYWNQQNMTKEEVLEILYNSLASKEFSRDERTTYIVKHLLHSNEPIKSSYFQIKLGVSNKIFNVDLQCVEIWLKNHNLQLEKKPSLGLQIVKDEKNIRKALVALAYQTYAEDLVSRLINDQFDNQGIFTRYRIRKIKQVMSGAKDYANFDDRSYIQTVLYLLVATYRIEQGHKVESDTHMRMNYINPGVEVAKKIAIEIEECLEIKLCEDEIIYLASYFVAFDIPLVESEFSTFFNKISQDVRELISIVQNITEINFLSDSILITDLRYHIKIAIPRLEMRISIQNSQTKFIKENYPDLFEATKIAFLSILKQYKIYSVSDEEIAFVTMHFCASQERIMEQLKIKVVVSCPTGVGTSKLLITSIKKEFSVFEVMYSVSALEIDTKQLKDEGIGLIISTVNLDIDFPHIKVKPILSNEDKAKLKKLVTQFELSCELEKQPLEKDFTFVDVQYISEFGVEISNILSSILWYKSGTISSKYEMIQKISSLLGKTQKDKNDIAQHIVEQEQMSTTYIKQFESYLFYCTTTGISTTLFGVIKLTVPFEDDDGHKVWGGIVILAPQPATQIHIDVSLAICKALAEEQYNILAVKTRFQLIGMIESLLSNVYKQKIKERMEAII